MRARCSPIVRPGFRETVVGDIVGLDAERVLDDLGGLVASLQLIACSRRLVMRVYSSLMTSMLV
jgi:hypothetical protein